MTRTEELMAEIYAAFNRRDVEAALARMSEQVHWPKASESGYVVGKQAIREYWQRQWQEFDPHVVPVQVTEPEPGRAEVQVHQVVKDRDGNLLSDQVVLHVYTLADGLIEGMDVQNVTEPAFRRS